MSAAPWVVRVRVSGALHANARASTLHSHRDTWAKAPVNARRHREERFDPKCPVHVADQSESQRDQVRATRSASALSRSAAAVAASSAPISSSIAYADSMPKALVSREPTSTLQARATQGRTAWPATAATP